MSGQTPKSLGGSTALLTADFRRLTSGQQERTSPLVLSPALWPFAPAAVGPPVRSGAITGATRTQGEGNKPGQPPSTAVLSDLT